MAALAPDADRGELEPMTPLDFGVRNYLKLSMLERWGVIPAAGDRHLAEFVPSILTEDIGWGAGLGRAPHARCRTASSDQADFIAKVERQLAGHRAAPHLAVGRDDGDGGRLAHHRRRPASCP